MALEIYADQEHDIIFWYVHDVCKTKEFYEEMKTAVEAGKRHTYRAEIVYYDDNTFFERDFYTSIDMIRETLRAYRPFMPERTIFRCLPHHQTDIPELLSFLAKTDKNIQRKVIMRDDLASISRELDMHEETLQALLQRARSQAHPSTEVPDATNADVSLRQGQI